MAGDFRVASPICGAVAADDQVLVLSVGSLDLDSRHVRGDATLQLPGAEEAASRIDSSRQELERLMRL